MREKKAQRIPKWMGLFGLFGFAAPIAYYFIRQPFTLIWLMWFGWFGWYYDGKMSGVLMDERYRENEAKAMRHASHTALGCIAASIFCCEIVRYFSDLESAFAFLLGSISFSLGLFFFLRAYLLFRYDSKE